MKLSIHKQTNHITDAHLTAIAVGIEEGRFFPIIAEGKLANANEFIEYKMRQFNLKSPALIHKAIRNRGYDSVEDLRWS